jgi:hypothetical protein
MMRFASRGAFAACLFVCAAVAATAQAASPASKPADSESVKTLERDFFDAIRDGDGQKVLSYIPKSGVNAGPDAHHLTLEEVQQQFQAHRGLYCYLFDSSCLDAAIDLGNSKRACSDRELLTRSEKVRTASSEVTRNNVQQAILVAEVKNDKCGNVGLVDFIFNLDADGWKLFSVP